MAGSPFTVNAQVKPPNPQGGGHYVRLGGGGNRFQLIHAVGPGHWAPGPPTHAGHPGPHMGAPHAAQPSGGAGLEASNPLLNPSQPLSGKALLQAGQGLVDAQTVGPLQELAQQIAANNSQNQAAIGKVGGYFNQLGQQAQQGVGQEQGIASGLNSTLQGIGQGEQQALKGIGDNAMGMLSKYAPGGSSDAAAGGLAQEIARQQGLAAQNQGAFQSFGANQGANYSGLAASNLGTFGLRGQEALRGIAQAGQLKDEPLNAKVAGIQASKGALLAKALGQLRQQEITNGITEQGLGIKQQANQLASQRIGVTQQNNLANQKLKGTEIGVTQQNNLANQNLRLQQINATLNGQNLSHQDRVAALAEKQAIDNAKLAGQGKPTKPLTPSQNNAILTQLSQVQGLIQGGQGQKLSEAQIRANLSDGANPAKRAFNPVLIQTAYELLGYGSIDQSTARQLHSMGIRGGTFRGKPIKVTANFNPGSRRQNPAGAIGGAVRNAGNAVGGALGG